jgi:hypothetical protein
MRKRNGGALLHALVDEAAGQLQVALGRAVGVGLAQPRAVK